jgi:hypothetical protein
MLSAQKVQRESAINPEIFIFKKFNFRLLLTRSPRQQDTCSFHCSTVFLSCGKKLVLFVKKEKLHSSFNFTTAILTSYPEWIKHPVE